MKTKSITIKQSNRNLTRNERKIANCMVHEGHTNSEINKFLAWYQHNNFLDLRLLSLSYTDRIRTQFNRFHNLQYNSPHIVYMNGAPRLGIDMLEAGYSWSGTDVLELIKMSRDEVNDLREYYLTEDGEATLW